MVKIRAQLRQKKLWKYTQKPLSKKSKTTKSNKHKKNSRYDNSNPIALHRATAYGQKTQHGHLLLQRIKVFLQPTGKAQFMRLSKKLYTL